MIRPRSCRVIDYFDTPALGIRHQSFDRVSCAGKIKRIYFTSLIVYFLQISMLLNIQIMLFRLRIFFLETLFNKFHCLFINRWSESRYSEINPTHLLSFYRNELDRQ